MYSGGFWYASRRSLVCASLSAFRTGSRVTRSTTCACHGESRFSVRAIIKLEVHA